ncbi:GAF domain-containing protein [Sphingomonas sp. ABOLD]|uniref:GAF domain-containing protein n=1 Tax=Sphingomonas trueperi TaxID=53317 RepID=A0A7X5XW77_9SPHN|nr:MULTISPECIES: GAF domain-containing protein [Sphingomonas]NJB96130.1 GAF domain-containing protein [Sphingomonas trueperi]RSV44898.1 GAF domain-containing protein [Sphingomonas sp. ABOLE]RSV51093.1 GAF domain-containing protein [Sphingomonas sp. ABOLD]
MPLDPSDEPARLAELKGYGVLDTPNEAEFDAIVREAATALGVPIALISLIDENRQWFKARVGLAPQETPRSISFCTHAIRGPDVFVVNDAKADPRFSENPLVTGDPNIRFYAGAPLRTTSGKRIGTLCVIDRTARAQLTEQDTARLTLLAEKTMQALERRRQRLNAADAA